MAWKIQLRLPEAYQYMGKGAEWWAQRKRRVTRQGIAVPTLRCPAERGEAVSVSTGLWQGCSE